MKQTDAWADATGRQAEYIRDKGESKGIKAEGRMKETDRGEKGEREVQKSEIEARTKGRKRKQWRKKEMKI